ncbi:hypothetical protein BW721_06565 [Jeotgalibaca sp. PTS2502]|uniref:alpha/beta fold hydrolase n=1 Tax=Jeotgalibaca sp. PTS2502 TaxID=1903686 RepID=UPI00097375E7|nr:alpha/beta fold hydrolase [Jeotgalibaca sp. PTS2502]APZ49370.1 hypothetical protein BW721_06565 [Jeotgalibaca sp. PTS2502]
MKILKRLVIVLTPVLVIGFGAFFWYVNDYYEGTEVATSALTSDESVTVKEADSVIQFSPSQVADGTVGIIFYPGGKVDEEAYAPLMKGLAEVGYQVFLVEMPFNLAVFGTGAAEDIIVSHPEITNWYLVGHSLGGSMGAIFAEANSDKIKGLILLASYSTADLSESGLAVMSIHGSQDGVLNMEKLAEYQPMLPADFEEVMIDGGNHGQFGDYGHQEGDGQASLSAKDQQAMTISAITEFIQAH